MNGKALLSEKHNKGVITVSLDKAIKHGKEHRKPYRGAKRHFIECRNHGACDYCRDARLHSRKRKLEEMMYKIYEYEATGEML